MISSARHAVDQATLDELARLITIMRQLRDPQDGCPWDVQQTFESIAPYTIEEAYEVADAIAALRPDAVLVELCSGRTQMLERIDVAAPPSVEHMLQQIQANSYSKMPNFQDNTAGA